MNNEPVAWMDEDENVVFEKCKVYPIPLYTHPVKELNEQLEKELTEAGGMIGVLREYISDLENGLDSSIKLNKAQAERQVKELTDEEIIEIGLKLRIATTEIEGNWSPVVLEFARAILRKAQEK
jgi:hypothetical protein